MPDAERSPYPFDAAGPDDWECVGDPFPPLGDEVHIWRATWEALRPRRELFEPLLSPHERSRAERYITEELTESSVLTHGWVREVLARYLEREPTQLEFHYGEHDKPALATGELHFNVSHTADTVVVAVTTLAEFGIDIEHERVDRDLAQLARRYFAPREVERFDALPIEEQPAAFYRAWTRKEAYLKAKGGGLTLPLDRFVVTLDPDEPPHLVHTDLDPPDHPGWHLLSFRASPDIAGALILPREVPMLRFFDTRE